MAAPVTALTLAQYAMLSNDPLVQAVTFSLIDNGSVLEDIPLVTKKTLYVNGTRWEGNLPSVNWAKINSSPVGVNSVPSKFQEQAYLLRNAVDVDKVLVQDENQIVDPRSAEVAAVLKSVAYDFNDKYINNDHVNTGGNADAPVGLKYRIDNGSVYGVRSENKIDSGGLDLTQATTTAAKANQFLEYLDQLLWSVDSPDGSGVVLYMNDVMQRRFATLMRIAGPGAGFTSTKDGFGRTITMYKGAKIRDIGRKADQTSYIITPTELANGSATTGGTYTSIYAAKLDMDHLFGWQFDGIEARDCGLISGESYYRTIIEWTVGLYNRHTRSMGRLFGLKLS